MTEFNLKFQKVLEIVYFLIVFFPDEELPNSQMQKLILSLFKTNKDT